LSFFSQPEPVSSFAKAYLAANPTGFEEIFRPGRAEARFSFGNVQFAVFGELKRFFAWGAFDDGTNIHFPLLPENGPPSVSRGSFDRKELARLIATFRAAGAGAQGAGSLPERPTAFNRLYLDVSLDCNLRCTYCYVEESRRGLRRLMPVDIARSAIQWLVAQRVPGRPLEIRFFGGEPLLNLSVIRKSVSCCETYHRECGIEFRYFLSTNGTLIDEECARFLARAGVQVKVSLDGPEAVHDSNRIYPDGAGSYHDALRGIEKLREHDIRPTVSVTSHRHTCRSVEQVSGSIAGLGDVDLQWQIISGESASRPSCPARDRGAEYEALARASWEELLCGENTGLSLFAPGIRKLADTSADWRGCGAGFDSIMVSPDGSFHLCQRFLGREDFVFGNLVSGCDTERLHALIEKNLDTYRRRCENCWLKYLCAKGCYYDNYLATGNIGTVDHAACETTQAYFKAVVWLCYMMALHLPEDLHDLLHSHTFLDAGHE
jgi:uncharacterized protein